MSAGESSDGRNFYAHVVDDAGSFGCKSSDLNALVQKTQARANATGKKDIYSIVGIMGCQSTGKSTLLNLLFGTKFQEMDSMKGRSQTTKGIWMDSGNTSSSLVIMDLEGTDSGERGEDRTTFERQTALYALALAEVLMINMWEHDIGRYTASNYGILKTVFEVNLQLFAEQNKTILMFVIRDHIEEETPLESLKKKLLTEIAKIWSELRKPEKHAHTQVEELFEFEFVALPHKKLQAEKFAQGVEALRKRFMDPTAKDYLYNRPFHGKKSVPIDGFGHYAHTIWETIKANKDLHLPTQREMLATFRCEEISSQIMSQFQKEFKPIKDKSSITGFGVIGSELLQKALKQYDEETTQYHPTIVSKKRQDLISKIGDELYDVYHRHIQTATIQAVTTFQNFLKKKLPLDGVVDDFFVIMDEGKQHALKVFNEAAKDANVSELKWNMDDVQQELVDKLATLISTERTSHINRLGEQAVKLVKTELVNEVKPILREAKPDMWNKLDTVNAKAQDQALNFLGPKYKGYRITTEEQHTLTKTVRRSIIELIRIQVDSMIEDINLYMRNRFQTLFRTDPITGTMKRWKAGDNISAHFVTCRDQTLQLLDLFSKWKLSDDSKEQIELIDSKLREKKETQFKQEIEGLYLEALSEQERNSNPNKLPFWIIPLIVVLGYDEIFAILRSPMLLFFLVITVGGVYILHQLGLIGPIKIVFIGVVQQILQHCSGHPMVQGSAFGRAIANGVTTTTATGPGPHPNRRLSRSTSSSSFKLDATETPRTGPKAASGDGVEMESLKKTN